MIQGDPVILPSFYLIWCGSVGLECVDSHAGVFWPFWTERLASATARAGPVGLMQHNNGRWTGASRR